MNRREFVGGMLAAIPLVRAGRALAPAKLPEVVATIAFPNRVQKYSLGFVITEEMLEDDLYGVQKMSKALGTAITNQVGFHYGKGRWAPRV